MTRPKAVPTWPLLSLALIPAVGCHQPADFVSVFDGKTLDGWSRYTHDGQEVAAKDSAFSVQDGMIYCSGQGKDYWIALDKKYRDVVLQLEYKITPGANSGIFLRSPGKARPAYTGYEVQIIDDSGQSADKHSSGSIYDVVTATRNMSKPIGQWNHIEITHCGSHATVVLNGVKVIDTDFGRFPDAIGKFDFAYADMPREGYIGLQNHGGKLWFRNIRIMESDSAAP